jgi:hypothetical protein
MSKLLSVCRINDRVGPGLSPGQPRSGASRERKSETYLINRLQPGCGVKVVSDQWSVVSNQIH